MSLSEQQAQQIMLVRVLEQTADNRARWSAGDAKEATRSALELVKAATPFDRFAARRAEWVLAEIAKRGAKPAIDLSPPRWPAVAGWLLVVVALAAGFVTDHFATERRVDIVEYPIVGLIVWNLVIFIGLVWRRISGWMARGRRRGGLLTDLIGRWRLHGAFPGATRDAEPWVGQFTAQWIARSAPLNRARVEFVLHAAAMFFAVGALASLYVRGFFKEYRAGWESTFFTADTIHTIASVVLAPGAFLLNLQIPDVQHVAGLRMPGGTGEIARDWIHLYAASILAWIILPRFFLALANRLSAWHLRRAFPLPLTDIYFTTLRAMRRGGNAVALVIPFRYELGPQLKANLSRLLERVCGLTASISIRQPVLMGEDATDWKAALGSDEHIAVFVIFNLAATAEPDAHGLLVKRILNDVGDRAPVMPIVDTGPYAGGDVERFRQRCNQWRSVLDEHRSRPLFLDLADPDANAVLKHLDVLRSGHD